MCSILASLDPVLVDELMLKALDAIYSVDDQTRRVRMLQAIEALASHVTPEQLEPCVVRFIQYVVHVTYHYVQTIAQDTHPIFAVDSYYAINALSGMINHTSVAWCDSIMINLVNLLDHCQSENDNNMVFGSIVSALAQFAHYGNSAQIAWLTAWVIPRWGSFFKPDAIIKSDEVIMPLMTLYVEFLPYITSAQKELGLLTLMHYLNYCYGETSYYVKVCLLEFIRNAPPAQIERVVRQMPKQIEHARCHFSFVNNQTIILDVLTTLMTHDNKAYRVIADYSKTMLAEGGTPDSLSALHHRLLLVIQELYARVYELKECGLLKEESGSQVSEEDCSLRFGY